MLGFLTRQPRRPDEDKTLEELDGRVWGEPVWDSYPVRMAAAIRRKRLRELDAEELRLGLSQHVGVPFLVPLAVGRLQATPLLAAGAFAGDLLVALLELPPSYWAAEPAIREQVRQIAERAQASPAAGGETASRLDEALARFEGRLASRPWLRPDEGAAPPGPPAFSPAPARSTVGSDRR